MTMGYRDAGSFGFSLFLELIEELSRQSRRRGR